MSLAQRISDLATRIGNEISSLWGSVDNKADKTVPVTQASHGFVVGDAIRHTGSTFVKAQANNDTNAQVNGIVSKVINSGSFEYVKPGGLLPGFGSPGEEYFLSPSVAGLIITLPDPESWDVGQVRLHVGTCTPAGLEVNIDVGDLVQDASGINYSVQSLTGTNPVWDMNLGINAKIVLSGDNQITMQNIPVGQSGNLRVLCSGNVGATYNLKFIHGTTHIYVAPNLEVSNGEVTGLEVGSFNVLSWYYDGLYIWINGTQYYNKA